MGSKAGLYPVERPVRKAITAKGRAWWYLGRDACHFHHAAGTWVTVRTSAIRQALAALDREVAENRGSNGEVL